MSFINWGEETPEQMEARARINEIAMIEEAIKNRRSTHHDMGNNKFRSSKGKGKGKARGGGSAEESD
jgi:hypothetical protein